MTLQSLRKLLFYIFAALYLVLCPTAILYALGYILVPQSLALVRTGTIFVSTIPEKADIYLNESRYALKTPSAIQNLLPGDYRLTVVLENHRRWSCSPTIAAGEAVRFAHVLLLPDPLRLHAIAKGPFRKLIGISGAGTLLAATGDELDAFWVLSDKGPSAKLLAERNSSFHDASVRDVFTVESSEQVVFRLQQPHRDRFLVFDTENPDKPPRDITELIRETPRALLWDPGDPDRILAVHEDYADRIEVKEGALYPSLVSDFRGLGLRGGKVYVLTKDNQLWCHDLKDADHPELLMGDSVFGGSLFDAGQRYRVLPFDRDRIVFLDEDGALLTNVSPFRFVEKGVRGVSYLASQDRLLVWTDSRIGILDFRHDDERRGVFQTLASLRWIYSAGLDITRCFWMLKGAYVVFSDSDSVYTLRVTDADGEPVEHLLNVEDGSAVHYAPRDATLYVLEKGSARLCGLPLIPHSAAPAEIESNPDDIRALEADLP